MIISTNRFIKKGLDARTFGFIILVRPDSIGDIPLIEHEKIHVKQFKANPIMFPLHYWLCRECRLKYEVGAYKREIEVVGTLGRDVVSARNLYARYLVGNYRLGISYADAILLLS